MGIFEAESGIVNENVNANAKELYRNHSLAELICMGHSCYDHDHSRDLGHYPCRQDIVLDKLVGNQGEVSDDQRQWLQDSTVYT